MKREFGSQLSFMGGVDTQGVLPNGSADDVRRATRRLIEGMTADGGGYILAASHTVPPETPLENIFAMYAEAGLDRETIFDRAADGADGLPSRNPSDRSEDAVRASYSSIFPEVDHEDQRRACPGQAGDSL